ncbi:MAG: PH domain-containing protein [Chloroflexia bacterium]
MSERPLRHRYPFWLAWPLELAALVLVLPAGWNYLHTLGQTVFQQWPGLLDSVLSFPYLGRPLLLAFSAFPAGPPQPWEDVLPQLLNLHIWTALYFFLAALLRNFLPALEVHEQGLRVRRGLGWALVPWNQIVDVRSMTLPRERLVILIQGQKLKLGPWFRLYSLLWGAGLKKGILVTWHISDFGVLADALVAHLQAVHGEQGLALIVDDTAYSLFYALLFLPRETWKSLFAPRQRVEDAYAHPKWLSTVVRLASILLLILGFWRYLGVWWRFFTNRFADALHALDWPILGPFLSTYGPRDESASLREGYLALLVAQVSMVLLLLALIFLRDLFPDWLLGAEGPSVYVRHAWRPIPWSAIHSIRETLFSGRGGVILLQVRRTCLTFWHALYSLFYGAGLRRGVLFTSLLPGFEELRERVHLGVVRAHESSPTPPRRPILQEDGEADFLLMLREPRATLRRWAGPKEGEEEMVESLFKRPGFFPSASELPWESAGAAAEEAVEERGKAEERVERRRARNAALLLALFSFLLILAEEGLFPPLSRPLALLALPPNLYERGLPMVLLTALIMGLLALAEWPFASFLLSMLAEAYEQPGNFRRIFSLYPRIQSPRILLALAFLALASTGLVQPLFLLCWALGTLWGMVLIFLAGRELFGWRGVGDVLTLLGYILFQGIILLLYFLLH